MNTKIQVEFGWRSIYIYTQRSRGPVEQLLPVTKQGVGSNPAQVVNDFFTGREWLLSALSKGVKSVWCGRDFSLR